MNSRRRYFPFSVLLNLPALLALSCPSALAISDWAKCLNEAQLAWAQNNLQIAEDKFIESIKKCDASDKQQARLSVYYLARLFAARGKLQEAENLLLKAFEANTQIGEYDINPDIEAALIEIYTKLGQKDLATKWKLLSQQKQGATPIAVSSYMSHVESVMRQRSQPTISHPASTMVCWILDRTGRAYDTHIAASSGFEDADKASMLLVDQVGSFGIVPKDVTGLIMVAFTNNFSIPGSTAKIPHTGQRSDLGGAVNFSVTPSLVRNPNPVKDPSLVEADLQRKLTAVDKAMPNSAACLKPLSDLSDFYVDHNQFNKATPLLERIKAYYAVSGHPTSAFKIHSLKLMGDIQAANNHYDQAELLYIQAITEGKALGTPLLPQIIENVEAYAKLLYKAGKVSESESQYLSLKSLQKQLQTTVKPIAK